MTEGLNGFEEPIPAGDGGMGDDAIPEQDGGEDQPQRVDLTQSEEWRRAQSAYDKRIAALEGQLNQVQSREYEAQRRADEAAMAGMDDYERAEYRAKRLEAENNMLRQGFTRMQAEQAMKDGLAAIAKKHGVPVDKLNPESPAAAEASALEYKLAQLEKKAKDAEPTPAQQPRNSVDLGGGTPRGKEARYRQRAAQLLKSRDTVGYINLQTEALREGIEI